MRCPKCGRASLPPDHAVRPVVRELFPIDESVLVIGPQPELPVMTPVASAPGRAGRPLRAGSTPPADLRRIVFGSVLFVSVTLLLFSALDHSSFGMGLFGLAAMVSLVVLALPARP
jgi:hypothetical protein